METELSEKLRSMPGFIYRIGPKHYFIGRWICEETPELIHGDTSDYYYSIGGGEPDQEAKLYFGKCRAYADLALAPPADPVGTKEKIEALVEALSEEEEAALRAQLASVETDLARYGSRVEM